VGAQACARLMLRFVMEEAVCRPPVEDAYLMDLLAAACEAAFLRCHDAIRELPNCPGSTATVLIVDTKLRQVLTANVGDSAVLVVDENKAAFASTDHRLQTNLEEQDRVLQGGGKLAYARHEKSHVPAGPLRMWPGGLAIARSLGDADCGDAVLPQPSINVVEVRRRGAMLVVCSDGVWDALNMQDVAAIARRSSSVDLVARRVVRDAVQARGLRDDMTAVVMLLGPAIKSKRPSQDGSQSGLNSPGDDQVDETTPRKAPGLFSCCFLQRRKKNVIDLDTTIKGGLQFEVLYRGKPMPQWERVQRENSSSPRGTHDDPSMGVGSWAAMRIDEASSMRPPRSNSGEFEGPGGGGAGPSRVGLPPEAQSHSKDCTESKEDDDSKSKDDDASVASSYDLGSVVSSVDLGSVGVGLVDGKSDAGISVGTTKEEEQMGQSAPRAPIPPGRKIHWNELGDGGISDMKFLGAGEFCSVFSSTIDGGKSIAIKMLRPNKLASQSAARDLEFEMHLMSRMSHRHVLRCIGTSVSSAEPDRKFLALSTLRSTLHDALPPPPLPDGTSTINRLAALKRWPMARALQLGLELAIAMRYLHHECFANYRLLHRDIKPKNLGLMHDGRLVVFDFGISKLVSRSAAAEQDGFKMTGMCGSLRYMAPEVAQHRLYNHLAEVYSFAIVLWEMVALRRPFESVVSNDFEIRVCVRHERPKVNEKKWPPQLCSLLTSCWAPEFRERPEFIDIVDAMMTLVAGESTPFSREVHGLHPMHA